MDAEMFYKLGRVFAQVQNPGTVVVGHDARDSSPELTDAIARGLMDAGVDVLDLGLCGTEEVYFATDHLKAGGGIMITASHNPMGDNGAKVIAAGARPISRASGLALMEEKVEQGDLGEKAAKPGARRVVDPRSNYVERVLSFADMGALRPMKVVVNAGNGAAGPTFDAIAAALADAPIEFIRIHHAPDESFPNGIPNPLLTENRAATADPVRAHGADLGVAWDGDFDRCFFFDETGAFVDGEYVVGLLSAAILAGSEGQRVVHDPRIIWNTQRIVGAAGGRAVASCTGHALVKEVMRAEDAVYGGEMSAHHYFRDFMYCDSGMIPWVLVLAHMSATGLPLSALVADMRAQHPSSGEINFRLADADAAVAAVEAECATGAEIDRLDGLSASFEDWRFNLRKSNTEPVVRLNVETLGDPGLLAEKTAMLRSVIERFA
ncbi:Phosphomannomutase [Candidatus Rhodobacter oscarellae]|uniref:Phosphomannomutase n=1 Tax=Candidatus Rhodobacter oscarellae TaxID=1675527 RepID=A0A0J9E3A2_9RHOB|nr:Phosphomannomutase [Candidatus Rhodobacter lobularis]